MREKQFKEVFQGIKLDKETDMYFDEVYVTNIQLVKSTETLYVYIESRHLIARQNIKKASFCIRRVFQEQGKDHREISAF